MAVTEWNEKDDSREELRKKLRQTFDGRIVVSAQ